MADYIQLVIPGMEPYMETSATNTQVSKSDLENGKKEGNIQSDRSPKSPILNYSMAVLILVMYIIFLDSRIRGNDR